MTCSLLVHGARAVVRTAAAKTDRFSQWVNEVWERRGTNRAIVAVANKNARIIWGCWPETMNIARQSDEGR